MGHVSSWCKWTKQPVPSSAGGTRGCGLVQPLRPRFRMCFFSCARAVPLVLPGQWTCERLLRWARTSCHWKVAGWLSCPTCPPGTVGEAGKHRAVWLSVGGLVAALCPGATWLRPCQGGTPAARGHSAVALVCQWRVPRSEARVTSGRLCAWRPRQARLCAGT